MEIFFAKQKQQKQQQMLKSIMKLMQQKSTNARKCKLLCLLIQISKQTKYDVTDILLNKKIKIFTKSNLKKQSITVLDKKNLQQEIHTQLLIPMYNFLMKLSLNQQLYLTCLSKQIPQDDIFRRGTKIRFIWIFKIYNLVHLTIPIMQNLFKFIQAFPMFGFFLQTAVFFYHDMIIMNNFVIKALEQAAADNYILMPYLDMLQFYQCLTEQIETSKKINSIYVELQKSIKDLPKPNVLTLSVEQISEIQVQALRVRLISNSLKNPKKDHTRLQTQYNVKSQIRERKFRQISAMTEGNEKFDSQQNQDSEYYKQKYKNLCMGRQKDSSLEQVSDDDSEQQQYQKTQNIDKDEQINQFIPNQ